MEPRQDQGVSDSTDEAFDEIMLRRNGAMLIATVAVSDERGAVERSGCMVGFATQCSISPRRFLLCLSVANHTTGLAAHADHVGVHAIPEHRFDLAELFGGTTGDDPGVDKLGQVPWTEGPSGVPLLDDCPDRFVGRILERVPLGDHVGYLLDPVRAEVEAPGEAREYVRLDRADAIDPGHPA